VFDGLVQIAGDPGVQGRYVVLLAAIGAAVGTGLAGFRQGLFGFFRERRHAKQLHEAAAQNMGHGELGIRRQGFLQSLAGVGAEVCVLVDRRVETVDRFLTDGGIGDAPLIGKYIHWSISRRVLRRAP